MNYVQEIESIFSDIDSCITEATNMSKNLLEYTKNKNNLYWMTESKGDSVKEKVKQLVNKVKEALQKIVNFFKEKTFKKAIENTKKNKEQVKLKGIHPDKKKKILTSSLNVLTTKAKEFKSMRGYNKISVPTAFALGWTPLLAPVPGASEILIALSSIGDFLLRILIARFFVLSSFVNFSPSLNDLLTADKESLLISPDTYEIQEVIRERILSV